MIHTTCFIQPIHMKPGDFWRFTPDGLSNMAKGKAEIIEASGWGNALVWPYILLGLRTVPIPHGSLPENISRKTLKSRSLNRGELNRV